MKYANKTISFCSSRPLSEVHHRRAAPSITAAAAGTTTTDDGWEKLLSETIASTLLYIILKRSPS